MSADDFQASLLRAARADRPHRKNAERVLAAATLLALETCSAAITKPSFTAIELVRWLFLPLAALLLAGDLLPPTSPPTFVLVRAPSVLRAPSRLATAPALALAPAPAPAPAPALAPAPAPALAPLDELTLLRRAKTSLSTADGPSALHTLAIYASAFPAGLFREESEALRIDALLTSGDERAARAAAARFLAAHPESPYAQRVQTLATRPARLAPLAPHE